MTRASLPTTLAALLLACSACSGDGRDLPDPDDLAAGPCRQAAPAVVALDQEVRAAASGEVDAAEARAALRAEQERLADLLPSAGELAPQVEEVITRAGFARVALDADSLGDAVVQDVTLAVDEFVAQCTPEEG